MNKNGQYSPSRLNIKEDIAPRDNLIEKNWESFKAN